jgi:plasmid rolling circle replication initiator protein Rep
VKNTNKAKKSQPQSSSSSLRDLKNSGKKRQWKKNRALSLLVSKAYFSIYGLKKYGELIRGCGQWLTFGACSDEAHGKKLIRGMFCKLRLCISCQWRRSIVVRTQVLELLKEHLAKYSTDVPLLLTLTVVNVPGKDLNKTIDRMNKGWNLLTKRKKVGSVARSWFRSLEVTKNKERNDYHPHFHSILMVPKEYFERDQELYIIRDEWLKLWQESMRDKRISQVDIRVVAAKNDKDLENIAAEVAKYATKPLTEDEIDSETIDDLHYALKGRRLVGYGGYFKTIRKEKKMVELEEADLNDIIEDESGEDVFQEGVSKVHICKICKEPLVEEVYEWDFAVGDYLRVCSLDSS